MVHYLLPLSWFAAELVCLWVGLGLSLFGPEFIWVRVYLGDLGLSWFASEFIKWNWPKFPCHPWLNSDPQQTHKIRTHKKLNFAFWQKPEWKVIFDDSMMNYAIQVYRTISFNRRMNAILPLALSTLACLSHPYGRAATKSCCCMVRLNIKIYILYIEVYLMYMYLIYINFIY